jgi:hypothetical protein
MGTMYPRSRHYCGHLMAHTVTVTFALLFELSEYLLPAAHARSDHHVVDAMIVAENHQVRLQARSNSAAVTESQCSDIRGEGGQHVLRPAPAFANPAESASTGGRPTSISMISPDR